MKFILWFLSLVIVSICFSEISFATDYESQYPPAYSSTYVKGPSLGAGYYPHLACNPALSLTGVWDNNSWITNPVTPVRFHIDLGTAKTIKRIYYENGHHNGAGGYENTGAKTFTFWGSNSATAFAELTYATDTDWTEITTAQSTFDKHVASNTADPKYILVTNTTAYRYYGFKIADNWTDGTYISIRRVELQSEVAATSKSYILADG